MALCGVVTSVVYIRTALCDCGTPSVMTRSSFLGRHYLGRVYPHRTLRLRHSLGDDAQQLFLGRHYLGCAYPHRTLRLRHSLGDDAQQQKQLRDIRVPLPLP